MSIFPTTRRNTPKRVLDRAAQGAHDFVDQATDSVMPAVERVQEGFDRVQDGLGRVQDGVKSSRATVRSYPLAALAIAVVAGVLLGKISGR
jgi:hypothetical protein